MNFKLSNTILDEIHKITKNNVEVVSGTATLDPNVPTTKLMATSSYDVYLPNGPLGQQKVVTTTNGNGNIRVFFNNGYSGVSDDITLYDQGDMVIFWASVEGWHYRSYIYENL